MSTCIRVPLQKRMLVYVRSRRQIRIRRGDFPHTPHGHCASKTTIQQLHVGIGNFPFNVQRHKCSKTLFFSVQTFLAKEN